MHYAEAAPAVSPHEHQRVLSFWNLRKRLLDILCGFHFFVIYLLDDIAAG